MNYIWEENRFVFSRETRLNTVKAETEKINDLSINVPTNNITELNLIYAEAKLVSRKSRFSSEEQKRKC